MKRLIYRCLLERLTCSIGACANNGKADLCVSNPVPSFKLPAVAKLNITVFNNTSIMVSQAPKSTGVGVGLGLGGGSGTSGWGFRQPVSLNIGTIDRKPKTPSSLRLLGQQEAIVRLHSLKVVQFLFKLKTIRLNMHFASLIY